jgi:hypothetical protein
MAISAIPRLVSQRLVSSNPVLCVSLGLEAEHRLAGAIVADHRDVIAGPARMLDDYVGCHLHNMARVLASPKRGLLGFYSVEFKLTHYPSDYRPDTGTASGTSTQNGNSIVDATRQHPNGMVSLPYPLFAGVVASDNDDGAGAGRVGYSLAYAATWN